jgi:hypothetical protein
MMSWTDGDLGVDQGNIFDALEIISADSWFATTSNGHENGRTSTRKTGGYPSRFLISSKISSAGVSCLYHEPRMGRMYLDASLSSRQQ